MSPALPIARPARGGAWISTGFAITRSSGNACYAGPPVVSLCSCAAETLPGPWALSWVGQDDEGRRRIAASFGLDEAAAVRFREEMDATFGVDFGWPDVLHIRGVALDLFARWVRAPGTRVIEHGLAEAELDRFLEVARPPEPTPGYAPVGESGMRVVACRRRPMGGDRALGFDVVPWMSYGLLGCSWICHGWPEHLAPRLGVRQNVHGLLDTYEEAEVVRATMSAEDRTSPQQGWFTWRIALVAER